VHPFFAKLVRDNEDILVELEFIGELMLTPNEAHVEQALAACPDRMFGSKQVQAVVSQIRSSGDRDPVQLVKTLRSHKLFQHGNTLTVLLGEVLDIEFSGHGVFLLKRAKHVIDQYRSRSAREIGTRLVSGSKRDSEIGTLLRECEECLGKLRSETYTSKEALPDVMATVLAEIEATEGSGEPLIEFGIHRLDSMIGGLRPGSNTVIAALTSVGKSAFAQQSALHMGRQGWRVLMFSGEMQPKDVGKRFLVMDSLITHTEQQDKESLSSDQLTRLVTSANNIGKLPIEVVYCPGWNVEQVVDYCHESHAEDAVDVVIVDYLQLLNSAKKHESTEKSLDYIAKSIMEMGGKLGVATVVCAQLNDEAEGKAPELRHIRGSRAPGMHAWNVIMLSRSKHKKKSDEGNQCGFWVRKNRNGPIGQFKVPYVESFYQFDPPQADF
jgi:replicative DNA helicase